MEMNEISPLEKQLVINNGDIILNLTHNLTFVDDNVVNDFILKRFAFYEFLYADKTANRFVLEDCINTWSDYFNQLYVTTKFEYNPIENYNMTESSTESKEKNETSVESIQYGGSDNTNTSENANDTINVVYGVNGINTVNDMPQVNNVLQGQKTENASENGVETTVEYGQTKRGDITNNGNEKFAHELSRKGNIGVTTTQTMIKQERSLIINIVSDYVDKFKTCFNITM